MQKEIIGNHTLYYGDCLEIMQNFQNKSFDLLFTDPPYEFISKNTKGGGIYSHEKIKHLEEIKQTFGMEFEPDSFLSATKRLLKTYNACIFTNKNLLKKYITFAEDNQFKWDFLVWSKINPVPAFNGHYMSDKEFLFYSKESGAYFNSSFSYEKYKTIFVSNIGNNGYHPTEKPLEFCEKTIAVVSMEGGVVIDPYMGSGTTGVACEKLNRKFIGIEKEQKYFDIACKRIEAEFNQQKFNF